jgi:peptidoglycan/xylan/chitin deacetylase (PgdA/CDA1 family)
MKNRHKKLIVYLIIALIVTGLSVAVFTIFFDQAVLVRKGTIYRSDGPHKVVALTFDDGPSPLWTPMILEELKKADVKATFFMIGRHVESYPEIARRVAEEGHEIGNHSFNHHVLIYYKMDELEKEIKDTEKMIKDVTGQTAKYFRPPKAWLTDEEKRKIKGMGYKIVLWSLNSKDWVTFDDKYIIKYLLHRIRPGDIILFHDSGGVFSAEGGDRHETVKVISRLVEKLREKGYEFITISGLLNYKSGDTQD